MRHGEGAAVVDRARKVPLSNGTAAVSKAGSDELLLGFPNKELDDRDTGDNANVRILFSTTTPPLRRARISPSSLESTSKVLAV